MVGNTTYFKLTKLLYMVDLVALQTHRRTMASEVYLRQVDGPWPPKLNAALDEMAGYEVRRFQLRSIPMVGVGPSSRFPVHLPDDVLEIVAEVVAEFGHLSNSGIKTAVYRTEPMRTILKEESKGKDMRNKPVLYKGWMASRSGSG